MSWNVGAPERAAAIKARLDAIEHGQTFYSTGRPCRNGHQSDRYSSNGRCVACGALNMRKMYLSDPVKHRAKSVEKYANKHAAKIAKRKAWLANPDRIKQLGKIKRVRRKEQIAEYNRLYKSRNRELYASCEKARYAKKIMAMPDWVDRRQIDPIYERARRITAETGVQHEVDHIVPLQGVNVCGLHVPWNLQILTRSQNASKGNRL